MDSDQQEHIKAIRSDFHASPRVIDSLNNSIQALARDLYSKDTHFVFELIQNAEDNEYEELPSLSFRLTRTDPTGTRNADSALIIQNNEIGFSRENVEAICSVGKTTKSKIHGYIGEKGIGFKSVFRVTSTPHVFSNGYRFCLPEKDEETGLGYIVPRWIEELPQENAPRHTTIILPLDKQGFGYETIEEMLRDIEPETILFLSQIKEIRIATDSGDSLTISKDDSKRPLVRILIEGKRQGESFSEVKEFLLYTKLFHPPEDINEEKRLGIVEREVSIAFPAKDNRQNVGKIFAYLPVRSDTEFPFLINADFILPSSREEIQARVPWNRWLMKCVAEVVADSLLRLKESGALPVALLEALATGIGTLSSGSMFQPISDKVKTTILETELLPRHNGGYVAAVHARLSRASELRNLLTPEQLSSLCNSTERLFWLSGEITQDRTPSLRRYLTEELQVEEIDPEKFANLLSRDFLSEQSNDWFQRFYEFLLKQEALWRAPKRGWDPPGPLRSKPILRLEDSTQVEPFDAAGNPNAYLPTEHPTSFQVVCWSIAKHEPALEFLKRLGLSEPDQVADVIENILPKYRANAVSQHSDEGYRADCEAIFRVMKTDSKEKMERFLVEARTAAFVRATNAATGEEALRKPSEVWVAATDRRLRAYLHGNEEVWIVVEHLAREFQAELTALGSKTKVPVFKAESRVGEIVRIARSSDHRLRCHGGFHPDCEVQYLECAIRDTPPTSDKSEYIWEEILKDRARLVKGRVDECHTPRTYVPVNFIAQRSEDKLSKMGQLLVSSEWLPDRAGRFHRPAELCLDELPEGWSQNEDLACKLGMRMAASEEDRNKACETLGIDKEDLDKLDYLNRNAETFEEFKKWNESRAVPKRPTGRSFDRERRDRKILEEVRNEPEVEHLVSERSNRVPQPGLRAEIREYLRKQNTNEDQELVCQLCHKVMPFKVGDAYYFEATECVWGLLKKLPYNHLALCANCAAKYAWANPNSVEEIHSLIRDASAPDIPIILAGDRNHVLHFTEEHLRDLRVALECLG